jgi:hypothetical protein
MLAWVVIDRRHPLPSPKPHAIHALHLRHSSTFQPLNFQRPNDPQFLSPIFRILFQVPYPATPLFATLMRALHPGRFCGTKTAGVCINNSHSGTRPSFTPRFADRRFRLGRNGPLITLCSTQVLPFHILAHSFALFCTHTKLNPFLFKRFRTLCKKTPGVGVGGTNC